MCCCGDEHNTDPPYKTSRSAACCTLTTEIILLVINVILYVAVAVCAVLVCAIAVATTTEGSSGNTNNWKYIEITGLTCSYEGAYDISTAAECATAVSSKSGLCDDKSARTVTSSTLPKGCICDKLTGSDDLVFNSMNSNVMVEYNPDGAHTQYHKSQMKCSTLGTNYENPKTKADCEAAATSLNCADTTAEEVSDISKPAGCSCDSTGGAASLYFNTGGHTNNPQYNVQIMQCAYYTTPTANNMGICKKAYRRLLRESNKGTHAITGLTKATPVRWFDKYAKLIIPEYDSKVINEAEIKSLLHTRHAGRRLKACDDDENCAKLKKAGLEGCSNATTILSMFWPNNLFALLGVIFYSMIACNCCKGCCGGFQQKNKMVMVYSIIAAVWGLVQTILHAMLNGALTAVKEVCIATNQSSGLVAVIDGLATTILICTLFHALCTVLRLVSAFFMFKAQQVPHNGDAGANGGVVAAVVPAGRVVVVEDAK